MEEQIYRQNKIQREYNYRLLRYKILVNLIFYLEKLGKKMVSKDLYLLKTNRPKLRQEIAIILQISDIIHVSSLYLQGHDNDLSIFYKKLKFKLDNREYIIANNIYVTKLLEKKSLL